MKNTVLLRAVAAFACVACIQSGPTLAQVGPIEPIIITGGKPSKALADIPDLKDDYVVSVQVTVAADGSVSDVVVSPSSGDAGADAIAIRFMKEKKFLPALDANGQPAEAKAMGSVEVHSKSINKQLKANMKPPNSQNEVARVRKLSCKDFTWEVNRLRTEGASTDVSREIMPWVSLRVYMMDNGIPSEREPAYLEKWPKVLKDAEKACEAAPEKPYLAGVLTPLLNAIK
jgi:TonB family protein